MPNDYRKHNRMFCEEASRVEPQANGGRVF